MSEIFTVALGGALGAVSRYLLGLLTVSRWGSAFPFGTLMANFIGCFIIGLFMTLVLARLDIPCDLSGERPSKSDARSQVAARLKAASVISGIPPRYFDADV